MTNYAIFESITLVLIFGACVCFALRHFIRPLFYKAETKSGCSRCTGCGGCGTKPTTKPKK